MRESVPTLALNWGGYSFGSSTDEWKPAILAPSVCPRAASTSFQDHPEPGLMGNLHVAQMLLVVKVADTDRKLSQVNGLVNMYMGRAVNVRGKERECIIMC
ncbi:uncharacterized protein J3R85_017109 [Psidium guajava]|nr:uncharacterized protein J3R85_017109 [Psidium guajava]